MRRCNAVPQVRYAQSSGGSALRSVPATSIDPTDGPGFDSTTVCPLLTNESLSMHSSMKRSPGATSILLISIRRMAGCRNMTCKYWKTIGISSPLTRRFFFWVRISSAGNIGRKKIRCKLGPFELATQSFGVGICHQRFTQSRVILKQHITV